MRITLDFAKSDSDGWIHYGLMMFSEHDFGLQKPRILLGILNFLQDENHIMKTMLFECESNRILRKVIRTGDFAMDQQCFRNTISVCKIKCPIRFT